MFDASHIQPPPHSNRGTPPETGAWWTAGDGKQLPYRSWTPATMPATGPVGLVVTIHGIGGAASDFDTSARSLTEQGFVVYGLELRGQGNDPDHRQRGDIRGAGLWFDDLREFHHLVSDRHPRLPVIWFGESLGALIALHTGVSGGPGQPQPDALVLSVPVVGFRDSLPRWQEWLLRALARIAPTKRIDLASLDSGNGDPLPVTTDQAYFEHMISQPHYLQVFTLRLLRHIGELVVTSPEAASRWHRPVLVQYAGNDVFTPAPATEAFIRAFPQDAVRARLYPESHHLLFHDLQSRQAIGDIVSFLNEVVEDQQHPVDAPPPSVLPAP